MTNKDREIYSLCEEINCIMRILKRTSESGDDVSREAEACSVLVASITNEIRGYVNAE